MKQKILTLTLAILVLSSISIQSVLAADAPIVITPPWPIKQNTPATFQINVTKPTYKPHILLVMTEACYNGLANVKITFASGSIQLTQANFSKLEGNPPPKIPSANISDVQYVRSSLADHLGLPGASPVYWAMANITNLVTGGVLTTKPEDFTVTLNSAAPRMLVYAIGKASATDAKFNRWVPPTNAGFVVPELGPILLALASFCAFALYSFKTKKVHRLR